MADGKKQEKQHAEVTEQTVLETDEFRWITLKRMKYRNEFGQEGAWEAALRTTRKGEVDAVFIVAEVVAEDKEPQILLVSQFRPPTEAYCLEFPAGLVDDGESAETAALRELREETGYCGEVRSVSPALFVDPGMSTANLKFVSMRVDLALEMNQNPKKQEDEEENITTHLVAKKDFLAHLQNPKLIKSLENKKTVVSGLLYAYALGMMMQPPAQ